MWFGRLFAAKAKEMNSKELNYLPMWKMPFVCIKNTGSRLRGKLYSL